MRRLKLTLADGKPYTFSTLTRKQIGAIQHEQKNNNVRTKIEELEAKELKDNGLEIEDAQKLAELRDIEEKFIMKMVRMSISVSHPEFAIQADPVIEDQRTDALSELMDFRDISIVSQFSATGTVPTIDDKIVKSEDIDLT
jgi:hypothetical protein